MQRLQQWFERLAGAPAHWAVSHRTVEDAFRQTVYDPVLFERPALWRRRTRVVTRHASR